jgi:hypothetical protein
MIEDFFQPEPKPIQGEGEGLGSVIHGLTLLERATIRTALHNLRVTSPIAMQTAKRLELLFDIHINQNRRTP